MSAVRRVLEALGDDDKADTTATRAPYLTESCIYVRKPVVYLKDTIAHPGIEDLVVIAANVTHFAITRCCRINDV